MENKEYLAAHIPHYMALTGRINDWLKDESSRLPVSCTTYSVEDSMEGINGIEDSWLFTSNGLRYAAGVAVDLSKLRPRGTSNEKGLVASGVVSFARFYSLLNEELRRGGVYKNGAVTLFLDYDHPDCEAFLDATSQTLPWAKRAVYVDGGVIVHSILPKLLDAVNKGYVWLAKKQWDKKGERLYSNVCLEVLLPHRGTCLLSSVNLGKIGTKLENIPFAFASCMRWLCNLHAITGIGDSGYYLHPSEDKQVGLGVIGLANLLAINGVSYRDFANMLILSNYKAHNNDGNKALDIATYIRKGYEAAAKVAREYKMERAFAIAPTASMSYRYVDAEGFTTAPEISAPLDYEVDRDSDTFGVETFEYHPKTEIAKNVGWNTQWKLLCEWQKMMDNTGLAHAISANIWTDQYFDKEFMTDFLNSPLKTTYYRVNTNQDVLDKSQIVKPSCSINKNEYCEACGG